MQKTCVGNNNESPTSPEFFFKFLHEAYQKWPSLKSGASQDFENLYSQMWKIIFFLKPENSSLYTWELINFLFHENGEFIQKMEELYIEQYPDHNSILGDANYTTWKNKLLQDLFEQYQNWQRLKNSQGFIYSYFIVVQEKFGFLNILEISSDQHNTNPHNNDLPKSISISIQKARRLVLYYLICGLKIPNHDICRQVLKSVIIKWDESLLSKFETIDGESYSFLFTALFLAGSLRILCQKNQIKIYDRETQKSLKPSEILMPINIAMSGAFDDSQIPDESLWEESEMKEIVTKPVEAVSIKAKTVFGVNSIYQYFSQPPLFTKFVLPYRVKIDTKKKLPLGSTDGQQIQVFSDNVENIDNEECLEISHLYEFVNEELTLDKPEKSKFPPLELIPAKNFIEWMNILLPWKIKVNPWQQRNRLSIIVTLLISIMAMFLGCFFIFPPTWEERSYEQSLLDIKGYWKKDKLDKTWQSLKQDSIIQEGNIYQIEIKNTSTKDLYIWGCQIDKMGVSYSKPLLVDEPNYSCFLPAKETKILPTPNNAFRLNGNRGQEKIIFLYSTTYIENAEQLLKNIESERIIQSISAEQTSSEKNPAYFCFPGYCFWKYHKGMIIFFFYNHSDRK